MGRLIYTVQASLDGRVADARGDFGFAAPDEEVHAFINDLERDVGIYLYGRRIYEVMTYWQDPPADSHEVEQDYGRVWRAAEKVVYSASLGAVSTPRTRLERRLDAGAVRELKTAAGGDLSIGGAALAGSALQLGLVDEVRLFVVPHLVGSGPRALPEVVTTALELTEHRAFGNGTVYLHYSLPR